MKDDAGQGTLLAGLDILGEPVSVLRGVAGRRAAILEHLQIRTLFDLATYYPKSYEDWSPMGSISELPDGQEAAFVATVARAPATRRKGRLSMVRTVLRDDTGAVAAIWFNQPWMATRLVKGTAYLFRGRVRRSGTAFDMANPAVEAWESPDGLVARVLRPVYRSAPGLPQATLRTLVDETLGRIGGSMPDPLPDRIRRDRQLCAVDYALRHIHAPESPDTLAIARKRLVFEEFFLVLAGLALARREGQDRRTSPAIPTDPEVWNRADSLPYVLTDAQRRTLSEVLADMARPVPMHRLVQGDVGSGKTAVAAMAMLASLLGGHQAVLMAPTAILAEQHARTLASLLPEEAHRIGLLTAGLPLARKNAVRMAVASGEIRVIVGTHALLEDSVQFRSLGLAVTDEQHRFGVRQRLRLSTASGQDPHVLVMSATPIPRTLGLVLYGDLDISRIDQMPGDRVPIETYTCGQADADRVTALVRREIREGRQAYVVCPLIETGEDETADSAVETHRDLSERLFPDLRVGLLHGGLAARQKTAVMDAFHRKELDLLVSTTVIEVGVDNPNATIMWIRDADRFGLAQLHQLRGRVGRGPHRSFCLLQSDTADSLARERLRVLCRTRDGFQVAERDLELRGPGDFFGTRQHGIPDFRVANLYQDLPVLEEVRRSLESLLEADPDLSDPGFRTLRQAIRLRFGPRFDRIGI